MPRNPDVLADCEALDELLTVRGLRSENVTVKYQTVTKRSPPLRKSGKVDYPKTGPRTDESLQSKAEKTIIPTLRVTSLKTITYSAAFLLLAFLLGIVIS
jgi:hypothetical protein